MDDQTHLKKKKVWPYLFTGLPCSVQNAAARFALSRLLTDREPSNWFFGQGISEELANAYNRAFGTLAEAAQAAV